MPTVFYAPGTHRTRPRSVSDEQIAEIRRLRAAGRTYAGIEAMTGVAMSKVIYYATHVPVGRAEPDDVDPEADNVDEVSECAGVTINARPTGRGWQARIFVTSSNGTKSTPTTIGASTLALLFAEISVWAQESRAGDALIVHPELGDDRPRERRHVYRTPVNMGVHQL